MTRIVLSTFGSYGDLNPYIAIGVALRSLGAEACIAAPQIYRQDVLRHGLEFAPLRPSVDSADVELVGKVMNPWTGAEFMIRKLLMPALRQSYDDLFDACDRANLLLCHILTLAGPIVAEKRGVRWATAFLQPMVLFSAYDTPIIPPLTALRYLRGLGPRFNRGLIRVLFAASAHWGRPVHELRSDLGLGPGSNPLIEAYRSPFGNLALFPEVYAARQSDWPTDTEQCGFAFLDEDLGGARLSPEVDDFLGSGPPPLIFTLGSAAVRIARDFVARARASARHLNMRALIVAGQEMPGPSNPRRVGDVLVVPSIPYFEVFPRGRAIVHSGGIGTTAHALRAGVPQVVVPFGHDQFDNAHRVARLQCGIDAGSWRISVDRLARHIGKVLIDQRYALVANNIAKHIRTDGAHQAARRLLRMCRHPDEVDK